MYHLNTMAVEQTFADLDRRLTERGRIQLATAGRITLITKVRRHLASILISTGERIRPEYPMGEPRYNG